MKKSILEYKIKNRYLIYMFCFAYIFGSFLGVFIHSGLASSTSVVIESFESYSVGATSGTSSYCSFTGYFQTVVSNTRGANSTSKSLYTYTEMGDSVGTLARINYISPVVNISKIEFYIYPYSNSQSGWAHNIWVNFTIGSTVYHSFRIESYYQTSSDKFFVYDSEGNKNELCAYSSQWYKFIIRHVETNVFNYSVYNAVGTRVATLEDSMVYVGSWSYFNYVYFKNYAYGNGNLDIYFDQLKIITGDVLDSDTLCGYDMSSYEQIGYIKTNYEASILSKYFYTDYNIPITTTITGISLPVTKDQYLLDTDMNNYKLSINDDIAIYPDCMSELSSGIYTLFWKTNIALNNETLRLNFTHTTISYGIVYWYLYIGGSQEDIDNDGDSIIGYNVKLRTECNWIWIGNLPFYQCKDIYDKSLLYDASYIIYHTGIQTINEYNYSDTLDLYDYSSKNSTGYIYDLSEEKVPVLSYTLSDNLYDYTIECYKNGTQFNNTEFPYKCKYPGGTVGFTSISRATFNFKLKKVSYVANITAYFIGDRPNFYVTTNPSITNQYQSYKLLYRYYHPQNYSGDVSLFDDFNNINTHSDNIFSQDINNNVDSNFTYQSTASSTEYWRLFAFKNNLYYPIGSVHKHYIRIPSIVDNKITSVEPLNYIIDVTNPSNSVIVIKGTHVFPGALVQIYIGGKYVSDIGGEQQFVTFYKPTVPGSFNIELRLIKSTSSYTLLDTFGEKLTISLTKTSTSTNTLFFIQAPYSYFAGTFIIVLLTLTPLIFCYFFKVSADKIPSFLYLIFGLIGFIISMLFGFFPSYSVVILIIVTVLILAIMYFKGKGQSV